LRVARAEWTKLRTLRSTRYSLLAGLFMTAAPPVIVTASRWHSMSAGARAAFDPLKTSLDGGWLAQLAVGVLGVLVISGEYSNGMIRSTLAAVPKRLPVLWAKAAVFALVTFALALPATLTAFFSVQAFPRPRASRRPPDRRFVRRSWRRASSARRGGCSRAARAPSWQVRSRSGRSTRSRSSVLEQVFRDDWGRVVASLVSYLRSTCTIAVNGCLGPKPGSASLTRSAQGIKVSVWDSSGAHVA
jgi:hypothetical protein